MNTKEQIEVMQAFVDGKEIEMKTKMSNYWSLIIEPHWDWDHVDYRVKEEKEIEKLSENESISVKDFILKLNKVIEVVNNLKK
jgi:hypothetical protein